MVAIYNTVLIASGWDFDFLVAVEEDVNDHAVLECVDHLFPVTGIVGRDEFLGLGGGEAGVAVDHALTEVDALVVGFALLVCHVLSLRRFGLRRFGPFEEIDFDVRIEHPVGKLLTKPCVKACL
jgi:hypothetical protein